MGSAVIETGRASILGGTGAGVRVGLIDTGVDSRHADLCGKIAANYEAVMGYAGAFVDQVEHGEDPNEHGTACAGILSRLAPEAEIHSVQVIGDHPRDRPEKLIAGLRFAVERGWEVINVSAGATRPHAELRELVERAHEAGTVVIAAKDNRLGVVGYPAAFAGVVAVGMDYFPDPLAWRYIPDADVEVEANGVYVDAPLAGGGQQLFTGSSFAAPHLAAVAARLKGRFPRMGGWEFREMLASLGA